MSYVPPHLRNPTNTTAVLVNGTGDYCDTKQLNNSSGRVNSTLGNDINGHSWNPGNRTSGSYISPRIVVVPDPVFPQWMPSERVICLKPEQIQEVRLRLNVDVTVSPDSLPAPAPIESFVDMNLCTSIMKDIAFHGYTTPTSIQAQAMPVALSGWDLLGCAETGSGKTAAFTIPMIQHCLAQPPVRRGDGPLALVLAPTRELAQQIEKEVKAFSRSLDSFRTAIVVGGTNISEQRSELRAGVNIVVATPGRFIDHLQQGNSSLSRISFVVLDEADRMLDMGFELQIREVMRNLPEKHQTLLFSATMPVEIEELAQEYLTNPVRVKVGKVSSPTANVSQILEKLPETEKIDRLLNMLVGEAAQSERSGYDFPLTIVFVERKTRCDEVAEALIEQGLQAAALHGGRSQSEREAALHNFRHGPTRILVATDVASRGLDVTGVAHVINLDLPKTMEDYVHRIGRTGRAGSTGQATSFYTDRDMYLVAQIKKAIVDVDCGNTLTIATGKTARRKEREALAAQKEARIAMSKVSVMGPTAMNVEDKYRHMITSSIIRKEGSADDAWDD
ncbi:ATP-dependent RNA helicase DBP2-like isoform X1 [Olea europaea var. sylvestris]|uniref:ATP-dependent RNA helicase DBP2-like n=2 Tax=Olea europaea subsp. europaea TaxID=158383 RepID=A0A8S0QGI4_OLEEU|nr:ATP-dependent RNA helicase DBP2-like isoform X1 [Olea europaea var. sylvestris]CAA2966219.1 ATP-dependent RNA helicase DBP2-like [Olea europaea subsp. europaea]